jgi:hypothetical protein
LNFCGWIIMTNTSIGETWHFSLCLVLHYSLFNLGLLYDSISSSKSRTISWILTDVKGSEHNLIWGTVLIFVWGVEEITTTCLDRFPPSQDLKMDLPHMKQDATHLVKAIAIKYNCKPKRNKFIIWDSWQLIE